MARTSGEPPPETGIEAIDAARAPLLRMIHIENLKSLAGEHTIPLAPLTLIYGPNAAGKSTIIQSLQLLRDYLDGFAKIWEPKPWSALIKEFRLLVSRHDVNLGLGLGMDFTSAQHLPDPSETRFGRVRLTVRMSNQRENGIDVLWQYEIDGHDSVGELLQSNLIHDSGDGQWFRFGPFPGPEKDAGLAAVLQRTFFLGPHRGSPSDPYLYRQPGLMPFDLSDSDLDDSVLNEWLGRLDVPYSVSRVSIEEQNSEDAEYLKDVDPSADWAGDSVPLPTDTIAWRLVDLRSDVEVTLDQVGYGVSQLLPIVDVCVRDSNQIICIEQPELHLHPRLQANLGDLFADTVIRRNQIIAETHSKSILIRVRKLVRQGLLQPDDVAIIYVDNGPEAGVSVRRLRLGARGELLDPWPTGFFDDSLSDVLGITE